MLTYNYMSKKLDFNLIGGSEADYQLNCHIYISTYLQNLGVKFYLKGNWSINIITMATS